MRNAEVLAVLAVEAPCHRGGGYAVPAPRPVSGSWGAAREALRASVSEISERYPGLTVRAQVAEGLVARVLLDHAADADMLVLGRTPHPADPGHSAGPVIRACLRSARCPVVAVALTDAVSTGNTLARAGRMSAAGMSAGGMAAGAASARAGDVTTKTERARSGLR